ncbi:MAG: hypothetical protein H8E30_13955 [Alphaproteobacteria bacterium]|nr:hypothetical protein [Alphaproteobacteria bacterium]
MGGSGQLSLAAQEAKTTGLERNCEIASYMALGINNNGIGRQQMADNNEKGGKLSGGFAAEDYRKRLQAFDAAVCEAIAVSQACSERLEAAAIGYSTHVFARICAHAQAMMCAAALSDKTT